MSDAYDRELQQLAMDVGLELGYGDFLKEGVYCVLGGPSFETIAECRMLHRMGADAVGEHLLRNINRTWPTTASGSNTYFYVGKSLRILPRHEHGPRGDHSAPLRHARLCSVPDHQPGRHGLREQGEGQPRGGPPDGEGPSIAAGAAGVHHSDPNRAQQQLRLNQNPGENSRRVMVLTRKKPNPIFIVGQKNDQAVVSNTASLLPLHSWNDCG